MEKSKILVIVGLIVIVLIVLLSVNFNVNKDERTNSAVSNSNTSTEMIANQNTINSENEITNTVENQIKNEVNNESENNLVQEKENKEETTTKKESNAKDKVLYSYVSGDKSAMNGNPEILDVYEKTDKIIRFKYHAAWLENDVTGTANKESEGVYSYKDGSYEIKLQLNSLGEDSIKVTEYKNGEVAGWENLFTDYKPADSYGSTDSTINIDGKYKNYLETEGSYYRSDLVIKNSGEDSIDFELSTAHGRDVDHVNIGELSKTATKIDVPEDMKVPDSTQYAYEFKDVNEDETNRIIFVYTAHRQFEYISISEEYATPEYNPYAGHGVFFAGEYEKEL